MWFQHQYGVWHDRTTEVPLEFSCEVIDKLRHFHAQDRKGCSLLGHVWRQAEVRNLPAWHSCHVNPWSISSPQHPWKRGESWPSCWCPLLWVVKAKETKKLCGWSGNLVSIQFKVPPPVKYSTMTRYVTDVTHCSDFWLGFSVLSRCWLLHPDCKKSIAWWVDGGSRCKMCGLVVHQEHCKLKILVFSAYSQPLQKCQKFSLMPPRLGQRIFRTATSQECWQGGMTWEGLDLFLSQMEGILATRTVAVFGIFHQRLTRCWLGTQRVGERSSDVPHGGLDIRWRYWNWRFMKYWHSPILVRWHPSFAFICMELHDQLQITTYTVSTFGIRYRYTWYNQVCVIIVLLVDHVDVSPQHGGGDPFIPGIVVCPRQRRTLKIAMPFAWYVIRWHVFSATGGVVTSGFSSQNAQFLR